MARGSARLQLVLVTAVLVGCGMPATTIDAGQPVAVLDASIEDAGLLDAGFTDAGLPDAGDAVDALLFERVAQTHALFATDSRRFWGLADGGSYRLDETPTYFVRRDGSGPNLRGFLLHHVAPANAFQVEAPSALGPVYRFDGAMAALGRNPFDQELRFSPAPTVYALRYGLPAGELEHPGTMDFLQYYVHEGFHRHQAVEGRWETSPSWFAISETGYPLAASHLALCILEGEVLREVMLATTVDATSAEAALRNFVAVRALRATLAEATAENVNATDYDAAGEQIEGTALYVETQFRSRLANAPFDRAFVADYLRVDQQPITSRQDALGYFGQGRTYGTGAAQGYLLDVLQVKWRDEMAQGVVPYDVVKRLYAPVDQADRDSRVTAMKQRFAFDTMILPRAQALAALP